MPFDTEELKQISTDSGVYLMKNMGNKVIYIGKAKNLRSRLRSYFSSSGDERQTVVFLRDEIETIETIIVPTERDALLLENNLIKKHKPKYNILLKDDKTFIRLILTSHNWPMLQLVRGKKKPPKAKYIFGPYTNAKVARQTLNILQKLFPLRQCSDQEFARRERPCLLYDIKKCCAPCVGKVSKEEYQEYVEAAKKLLLGKDKETIDSLQKKMLEASEKLEFEKAAKYKEIIDHIKHALRIQYVENPYAKDTDVLGLFRQADTVMLASLHYREGKLISSKHFSFHQILFEEEQIIENFLLQHYSASNLPKEIYLPIAVEKKELLEEILSERKAAKVKIFSPTKGQKKELVEIAYQNAKAQFIREEDKKSLNEKMLLDLQETVNLLRFPQRIECVDTSHIAGESFVACIVSYFNGEKEKARQKYFTIKTLQEKADDYGAMKEVLHRHFSNKEKEFCDLLILDGGKGHLQLAKNVFSELNITNVDIISLAKEKSLHTKSLTKEKIYTLHAKEPISLHPHSPLLFLLQKIRDETHRVAITFHKKKREKKLASSELDTLKGIGPKKKKLLLIHFKSPANIKKATKEELEKVPGLTKKDIQTLIEFQKK